MNVQIDKLQQDKFIRPIFEALVNHADDATIIKVYFDTNLIQYSKYIPDHIMSNPLFIKEAIKKHLIDYDRLPDSLKNTDFITKDDYLHLIECRQVKIDNDLYPQDKEIILKGIHGIYHTNLIEPKFRDDVALMAECVKVEGRAWHYFDKQAELLKDKDLVADILIHNKDFFIHIPDEERKNRYVLKAMLTNIKGYNVLDEYNILKTITDPELVLDALKINPNIKVIHQKFSSIIKEHDAKKDPYNFLKAYLMMNSLEEHLEQKNTQPKSIKL